MKPLVLFKGTTGLNNVVTPVSSQFDPESGIVELSVASNIDINNFGKISRRNGLTATARTEASHSLFCSDRDCLFIAGNSLYRLNLDYTRTGIRSGLTTGVRMSYCQIDGKIYYSNGFENGYVKDNTSYAWQASAYVGPATTKVMFDPPVGHLLEYLSSRIYIATEDGIEYSEPFAYSWFARASNFLPIGRPRMLRAVDDGLYVGLESGVVFLKGKSPKEFEYSVVSNSPVVAGTDVKVSSDRFGKNDKISLTTSATINAVMWTAHDGIYLGSVGGEVKNLTKNRLTYRQSQEGCAVFEGNKYITLMK